MVFDAENLPYSSRLGVPEGLNVEVARLVAVKLDVALDILWTDTEATGLLSHLIADEKRIQLAFGVPVEPRAIEDEGRVGDKITYSIPYASTRYILVTRKTHKDLPDFQAIGLEHIGVEVASVASGILWDRGFIVEGKNSQGEVLQAVATGQLGYAALWSNAGWLIENDIRLKETLKVQTAEPGIPGLAWNLAVAIGRGSEHLLGPINNAIAELKELDAFRPLFLKYHVPYFEPVDSEVEIKK